MSNKLIPNSFQHPNFYTDRLSAYITPTEEKVLNRAIREILGWQDKIASRKNCISLSVFTEGRKTKDGKQFSLGCGLSTGAVRQALTGLITYKILIRGGISQDGTWYELQTNDSAIDWSGLEQRLEERKGKRQAQTDKARQAAQEKDPLLSNRAEPAGCCPDPAEGVVQQQPALQSNNNIETQSKPNTNPTLTPSVAAEPEEQPVIVPNVGDEKEPIIFKEPKPRRGQRTEIERRASIAAAMDRFQRKHSVGGEAPIAVEWQNLPVAQGQILTEFYELSGISPPVTRHLRDPASFAAETLYQECGSAAECIRRMQLFFKERAGGAKYTFFITGPSSIVKSLSAMGPQASGPKVIRVGG